MRAARLAVVVASCAASLVLMTVLTGCAGGSGIAVDFDIPPELQAAEPAPDLALPEETHLANVRQMTFGGENAEAYWSFNDRYLIFQSTRDDLLCDQIFIMDAETGGVFQVTDRGRTTCAFFIPDAMRILFASTHEADEACPPNPDRSMGYVWPVFDSYEIYTALPDGTDLVNITNSPGYDAEATVSRGGRIVFTSTRSGDLELWSMEPDGSDLQQLTDTPGYDGGAFFSPDGTKIVWRASRFDSPEEEAEYRGLLEQGLVRPSDMQIFVADADGSNAVQLTDNGAANFAPYFTPDGGAIVYASNKLDDGPPGRTFEIWMMDLDGGNRERITWDETFNSFPMFSWDGKKIAFSSNRHGGQPRETNVFIADWIE